MQNVHAVTVQLPPDEQDLEMLQDVTTDDTVNLILPDDNLKHKVIFIAF